MSYTWLLFFELRAPSGVINDDLCHRIEPLELLELLGCPALSVPIAAVFASSYARLQMGCGRLSALRVIQQRAVHCDSLRRSRWLFGHAKA